MFRMTSMVEVERPVIPQVQSSGALYRPKERLDVAGGINDGAKISLFYIKLNAQLPLISAFIYPATYELTPARIYELDSIFSNVESLQVDRTFYRKTVEIVNEAFLEIMGSEVPFTTQTYQKKVSIIHHGFTRDLEDLVRENVRLLRIK